MIKDHYVPNNGTRVPMAQNGQTLSKGQLKFSYQDIVYFSYIICILLFMCVKFAFLVLLLCFVTVLMNKNRLMTKEWFIEV